MWEPLSPVTRFVSTAGRMRSLETVGADGTRRLAVASQRVGEPLGFMRTEPLLQYSVPVPSYRPLQAIDGDAQPPLLPLCPPKYAGATVAPPASPTSTPAAPMPQHSSGPGASRRGVRNENTVVTGEKGVAQAIGDAPHRNLVSAERRVLHTQPSSPPGVQAGSVVSSPPVRSLSEPGAMAWTPLAEVQTRIHAPSPPAGPRVDARSRTTTQATAPPSRVAPSMQTVLTPQVDTGKAEADLTRLLEGRWRQRVQL